MRHFWASTIGSAQARNIFFLYLGFLELFEVHDNLHWYTDVYLSLLSHYVQWCSKLHSVNQEKRQRMFFTKLKRHLRRGNNRPKGYYYDKDWERLSQRRIWIAYSLRSVLSFHSSFYVFFFREICGQRVAFLASSCIFMPVWRVKCLMSPSGQLARYGYIHVLVWRFTRLNWYLLVKTLKVFRGCKSASLPCTYRIQVFSVDSLALFEVYFRSSICDQVISIGNDILALFPCRVSAVIVLKLTRIQCTWSSRPVSQTLVASVPGLS